MFKNCLNRVLSIFYFKSRFRLSQLQREGKGRVRPRRWGAGQRPGRGRAEAGLRENPERPGSGAPMLSVETPVIPASPTSVVLHSSGVLVGRVTTVSCSLSVGLQGSGERWPRCLKKGSSKGPAARHAVFSAASRCSRRAWLCLIHKPTELRAGGPQDAEKGEGNSGRS